MKCQYTMPDGSTCRANSMENGYCFVHNPDVSDERKYEARRKGGLTKDIVLPEPLPLMPIDKPGDVIEVLKDAIKEVRLGRMDTRIANSIAILTNQLLKAWEVTNLNERVESIARIVLEKRQIREFHAPSGGTL